MSPALSNGSCGRLRFRKPLTGLAIVLFAFIFVLPSVAQSPSSQFRNFYDDLGQLVKVVDSTGTVIEYVYDPVGNILQIKRSTIGAGLAILAFTPQRGNIGQAVTIQGQGFSPIPTANNIQFNGTAAQVISAKGNTIVAAVPPGAITGLISVTVNNQTATSSNNFNVIPVPVITGLSRKSALLGITVPNFTARGFNFTGASFAFAPALSPPAISLSSPLIDSFGTSAGMSLATGPTQAGTFALVGTNAAGSSTAGLTPANRFTVVDPRSTVDSDGDGVPDVVEATFGSDPLDPGSVPIITHTPEAESLTFSVLNGVAPPHQMPTAMEADSLTFSLLNGTAPPVTGSNIHEADSLTVSLLNGSAPPVAPQVFEADSLTFSVRNTATTAAANAQPQIKKVAHSGKQKKLIPETKPEEPPQPAEAQRSAAPAGEVK